MRQDGSKEPHLSRRPVRQMCVLIFWITLRGSQNSSFALSQVMNHGFWSMAPETKRQSREWHTANSPRPKKAKMSKSKIKSMVICFFDSQGIVHKEFVPPGQTVNQTFYWEVLERLRKKVARVRPGIERPWMLHHDNAPCHTAVSRKKHSCRSSAPLFARSQSL